MKAEINFDGKILSQMNFSSDRLDFKERFFRGIKAFLVFFGFAVFSVFIPVLHFILVPAFLFVAVGSMYFRFKQVYAVNVNGLVCLDCKTELLSEKLYLTENLLSRRLTCSFCRKCTTITFDN